MMKKSFDIIVTDKNGRTFMTWGGCKNSTAETMTSIREWASKHGHTIHADTYREYTVQDDPAFVDACMSDISGFNR